MRTKSKSSSVDPEKQSGELSSRFRIRAWAAALGAFLLWGYLSVEPDLVTKGYPALYEGGAILVTGAAVLMGIWMIVRQHIFSGIFIILMSVILPVLGLAIM